jgi:hypothetical protein
VSKAKEVPVHQRVAEAVVGTLTPAYRKKVALVAKGSYTVLDAEGGWLARITPKVVEFNKKRIDEAKLKESGLTKPTKPFHFKHAGLPAAASGDGVDEKAEAPEGVVHLAEVGVAVTAAAKTSAK